MSREQKLSELFDPDAKPYALEGVRVVEISNTNFVAQIAAAILCELGAHVIKIEPPGGDPARYVTPYGVLIEGVGIPYYIENRCKEIVTLDFEKDRERIIQLISQADIVIDGMKPGELDRLGIGYRQLRVLNPKVIYLSISPFGSVGEFAEKFSNVPYSDLTAQAYNGYPTLIGNPYLQDEAHQTPLRAGIWVATIMAGVQAAISALVSLYWRELSGEGQFIDIAINEVLSAVHLVPYIVGFFFEKPRGKYGLIDYILYPFGYYKTADGYVAIATPTDADFRALLKILRLWKIEPDWRYGIDRISDDVERIKELDEKVRQAVARYKTSELIAKVIRRGVLYKKVPLLRSLERHIGSPVVVELYPISRVVEEKHWYIRRSLKVVTIGDKKVVIPSSPFKFSAVRVKT
ncbi:CaiB/BaiF CoA transferase family protein [Pyrobaculum aerophilum]|uniref:CaiB/BaiF CoA transferase family protein n=1 Tax=Pyrobaculum aerophilum TaxID=13773 RepID=UPI0023F56A8C|nr:CoA transferase [Pyrobaculum aerophilum]MCX8137316.1 CoA transferase [Pyrobaculum aerophilum]